jgi:hypothetical protein
MYPKHRTSVNKEEKRVTCVPKEEGLLLQWKERGKIPMKRAFETVPVFSSSSFSFTTWQWTTMSVLKNMHRTMNRTFMSDKLERIWNESGVALSSLRPPIGLKGMKMTMK